MPELRNEANETNRAADAGRKATDEAARTARTVTDEAAKVGEQTTRAAADLARQGAETTRKNLQAGLDTAAQSFQRMTDQFTQVLGFNGPSRRSWPAARPRTSRPCRRPTRSWRVASRKPRRSGSARLKSG